MTDLRAANSRLKNWTINHALPFWAEHGIDPDGGFWEALNLDGSPQKSSLRRVRVQARLAYVYAHAAALGWHKNAKKISDHAWNYLLTKGVQGGGRLDDTNFSGIAHLLNPDGTVQDGMRDTYAQAFLILAAAWRYRAFGDPQALTVLSKTLDYLNSVAKAENGGWLEGVPARLPRRQNPHMHLFEAFIAAFEATGEHRFLKEAEEVISLFTKHFFEARTGAIIEFFDTQWQRDTENGDKIEPGHMMEWAWLLSNYQKFTDQNLSPIIDRLFDAGCHFGLNDRTGLLINKASIEGVITNGNSRCWQQTEYIKASIARARLHYKGAENDAANMIDLLFANFLTVRKLGGWHDERDAQGNIISDTMPTSTFYHLLCTAAEVDLYVSQHPASLIA